MIVSDNITDGWEYLGKMVNVIIDRPLGTKHPKHDLIYKLNYGYIPNTKAGDGDEIDVYILGENQPVSEFTGKIIAIIVRKDDNENKLVVADSKKVNSFSKEEIIELIKFQEQYFDSEVFLYDFKN